MYRITLSTNLPDRLSYGLADAKLLLNRRIRNDALMPPDLNVKSKCLPQDRRNERCIDQLYIKITRARPTSYIIPKLNEPDKMKFDWNFIK